MARTRPEPEPRTDAEARTSNRTSLNETNREEVVRDVFDWLDARLPRN